MHTAQQLIDQFNLRKHPEGGWYKETYRSSENIPQAGLPARFTGPRVFSTAIYFLLEQGDFSAFHRIKSDECWHFYSGDPLLLYIIEMNGTLTTVSLGNDIGQGHLFQYVVPANCWFASKPAALSAFSFLGCTVAPGFDFSDFELANPSSLLALYPRQEIIIKELCR